MSFHVVQAVWNTSEQRGMGLLVLLALADYATDEGVAWPRLVPLARKTRLGDRHLRRTLRALELAGDLVIEKHPSDARRRLYRLPRYAAPAAHADTGLAGPVSTGLPGPLSAPGNRTSESAKHRTPESGKYRTPESGFPSKEEPSGEPSLNSQPKSSKQERQVRIDRVLGLWHGYHPSQVERPSRRRVAIWLDEWRGDGALLATLQQLRARGALTISTNYVHACLASALRAGGRPPVADRTRQTLDELQAAGRRAPPPPPIPVELRLAQLAETLPDAMPEVETWRDRVRSVQGEVPDVEQQLARLDAELLTAIDVRLSTEQREELEADLRRTLTEVPARHLSGDGYAHARSALRQRLLRRQFQIPVLSLFSGAGKESAP